MTLLTADDVLNVKFQASSFKKGYDQDEVDEFLDEVTTTMRGLEERLHAITDPAVSSQPQEEILTTSSKVRSVRFSTTIRSGYRMEEVDAFLAQIITSMEALEAQLGISSCAGQIGANTGASGADGGGTYGTSPAQTGYAPGGADATSQHAEAIAQRDQYIAQLQQENTYLRAELEAAQRRLGTTGY